MSSNDYFKLRLETQLYNSAVIVFVMWSIIFIELQIDCGLPQTRKSVFYAQKSYRYALLECLRKLVIEKFKSNAILDAEESIRSWEDGLVSASGVLTVPLRVPNHTTAESHYLYSFYALFACISDRLLFCGFTPVACHHP